MEVRSRQDAKSVCIKRRHGTMSAGEVLEEELCLLPEGCRIDWSAWSRARRKTKKRRAISRCCGGGVYDRWGGGFARTGGWRSASSLFLLEKAGYVYLLSLLCGCFHVVEIGRVPSINNIRSVSTMTTADSAGRIFCLETEILFTGSGIFSFRTMRIAEKVDV